MDLNSRIEARRREREEIARTEKERELKAAIQLISQSDNPIAETAQSVKGFTAWEASKAIKESSEVNDLNSEHNRLPTQESRPRNQQGQITQDHANKVIEDAAFEAVPKWISFVCFFLVLYGIYKMFYSFWVGLLPIGASILIVYFAKESQKKKLLAKKEIFDQKHDH